MTGYRKFFHVQTLFLPGYAAAMTAPRRPESRPRLSGHDELNDLVWEVSVYVEALGEAALSDLPLTLAGSGMLCLICDEPGITVAEMSR